MNKRNLIAILGLTILMLYHVLTLPADTNPQTRKAKWLGFFGFLFLSIALLINMYVVNFFKFHYSMLVIALIPACLYSLLFERQSSGPTLIVADQPCVRHKRNGIKNLFSNKCPVCGSSDLSNPVGWFPLLYTMKPITCNECRAKFEPNIISRVGFWLFMTVLFSFIFTRNYLVALLGKDITLIIFLTFIGLFFLSIVVGCIMYFIKPYRQFKLWDTRSRLRTFINYGAIISIIIYAIIYLLLRNSK